MLWTALALFFLSCLDKSSAAQKPEDSTRFATHFERAKIYLAQAKPTEAIREYQLGLAIDPRNVQAQANLGVILFFQNKCSQASDHLMRALELQPALRKIQALLGVCQKRQGDTENAKKNLEASISSITETKIRTLVKNNLVEIYYGEGDLQSASHTAEDLLKEDPQDPDVLFMIYRIHTDIANRARTALAAIAPDSARMHEMMAEHFINDGDATDAITQYERALVAEPALPGIKYELAEAVFEESKTEAALNRATTLFENALVENPNNAGAEAKLGQIAAIQNHTDMAERHFARALMLQQNELDALKGMAEITARKGNRQEAIDYLSRATLIDPLDAALHYRLSLLHRQLDQKAESEREMDLFKKTNELKKKSEMLKYQAAEQ